MAQVLIDASITLLSLFQQSPSAAEIEAALGRSELLAPWLWRLEVTNAILNRERRKLLTLAAAVRLLGLVDNLRIELVGEPGARSAAQLADLARPHQLTAYDAVYLDLALRYDLPLFSADHNLRAAAQRAGVPLFKFAHPL